jgi:hypothetical protein
MFCFLCNRLHEYIDNLLTFVACFINQQNRNEEKTFDAGRRLVARGNLCQ